MRLKQRIAHLESNVPDSGIEDLQIHRVTVQRLDDGSLNERLVSIRGPHISVNRRHDEDEPNFLLRAEVEIKETKAEIERMDHYMRGAGASEGNGHG
jgi:hypothetical protein